LNIGTLNSRTIESMKLAGAAANKKKHSGNFGRVRSRRRSSETKHANSLCHLLKPTLSKEHFRKYHRRRIQHQNERRRRRRNRSRQIRSREKTRARNNSVVVYHRAEDVVSNGQDIYSITNGTNLMGKIVGTGCMARPL
jgi:hydroxyethylthiazole kinase